MDLGPQEWVPQEQQSRLRQLELLFELAGAVSRAKDPNEIYRAAAQGLVNALAADRAAVLIFDPDGVMRFKAWIGLSGTYRAAVEGHTPWVRDARDAEPIAVADVTHDPSLSRYRESLAKEGIRAVAFIPLLGRGGVIGKFMLYWNKLHEFQAAELQVAQAIAADVAFATERQQAEEALRESEERFRNMADTTPVMIWCSGPDRLCTFVNKVWLDFTGRALEQELGNGWTEGVHPEDRGRCFETYSTAFDARRRFRMEYRLRRADGEYRWIQDEGVPRFTRDESFVGYIGSCIDITEVKRTQEETLAHQKLESVGQLARGIAHDFNNLLSGILACAEFALAERAEGVLPAEEHLGRIRTAAIRGAKIVRQLMTYAGEVHATFEPIDLSSLVEEMLQLLQVSISKQVILEAELSSDLPAVDGSPVQIRQVVMNLVTNASEAIGERAGVIRVTTTRVTIGYDAEAAGLANVPVRDYIKLEVSDTGSGMTPEVQTRVFDPFFTTKSQGQGLGLAVIQGIVRSHLGAINIVSSAGQGTHFEVLLPCADQSARTSAA